MKKVLLTLLTLVLLATPARAQIVTAQKFRLLTGVGGSDCQLSIGSGSPEGVLTGGICDMYFRTDGGASTTVYVKESGAGNTGWTGVGSGASTDPTFNTATISQTGLATTPADGVIIQNTTAATGGATVQESPSLRFRGNAWNTSASKSLDFRMQVLPASAATPTATFQLQWQRDNGGYSNVLTADTAGDVTIGRNLLAQGSYIVGASNLLYWNTRTVLTAPADGTFLVEKNDQSTGAALRATANNTLAVRNHADSAPGSLTANDLTATQTSLATTPTDGLVAANTTAATGGATVQMSPRIRLTGNAWDTSASQPIDFFLENLPTSAATPRGELKFGFRRNGGSITYPMILDSAGGLTTTSWFRGGDGTSGSPTFGMVNSGGGGSIGFYTPAGNDLNLVANSANQILWGPALWRNSASLWMGWSSNADPNLAVADTAMVRAAAAKIKFYNKPESTPDAGFVLDFATDATAKFRNRADSAYAAVVVGDLTISGTCTGCGTGTGNVTGPMSSTNHGLAAYAGTGGATLEDTGITAVSNVLTGTSTLIGGTGTTSDITIQTTTGNDSTGAGQIIFKGGNNGALQLGEMGFNPTGSKRYFTVGSLTGNNSLGSGGTFHTAYDATTSGGFQAASGAVATSTDIGYIDFGTFGTASGEKRVGAIHGFLTADATTSPTGELRFYTTNAGTIKQRFTIGDSGGVTVNGTTSGGVTLAVPAAAGSNTITLPAGTTDFSSTGGTSQVVKQTSSGGAFTVGTVADADLSTTDVTTNNATTSKHGFLLKLDNNSAHFMNGQGAWATPAGGSGITGPGATTSGVMPVWNSTDGTTVGGGTIAASNVALLDANNVFSNASGNSMKKTVYPGSTSGSITVQAPSVAGSTTLQFPGVNTSDVLVSRDSTDTLTNKTLTTPTIGSFTNATHTHTNAAGGGTLAEGALALTDITTNNASTSNHGFLLKLDNDNTHFMNGTGAWSTPTSAGGMTNSKRMGYMQWDPDATFAAGKEWVGFNGCTDGTINSDASTTGGIYVSHFSGSTLNNAVNIGCNTWAWPDHLPTVIIKFKTGPSITDLRFWAGLSASSAVSNCTSFNSDDPSISNVKIIGFRYSTPASDGGFVGYTSTGSGSNKTVSSTVNAIAVSTEYTLKIVVNSTSSVSFTVNGGTAQTITTNIPSGAALGPFLCAINTNNTTKRVDMSRFYVEAN